MLFLPVREILFWCGILLMVSSGFLGVFGMVLFVYTGKRLKKKLEEEYGKLPK